ncbi:hypothetical protein GCM10028833_18570 [Glycomyces tarimensis]
MRFAHPAPGTMGLGAAEPVHADAEQPVADRSAVEVGVETRHGDAVEVDVAESLAEREIGELREPPDFIGESHGHVRSNEPDVPVVVPFVPITGDALLRRARAFGAHAPKLRFSSSPLRSAAQSPRLRRSRSETAIQFFSATLCCAEPAPSALTLRNCVSVLLRYAPKKTSASL